jgi:hypothetical protein
VARRISAAFAIKWRFSMLVASSNVRVREQSGRYLLLLSSSQFDPKADADVSGNALSQRL